MAANLDQQRRNLPIDHRQQHQPIGRSAGDSAVSSSTASPFLPIAPSSTVPDVVMDAATSVGQHQQESHQQRFRTHPVDSDGWPIPGSSGDGSGMHNASMYPIKPPLIPVEFASDTTLTPEERLQFAQAVAPNNPHKSELVFPWTRAQVQSNLNVTQMLNAPLQSYGNPAYSAANVNWQYAAQQQFYNHLRNTGTPHVVSDDGQKPHHHTSSSSMGVVSPGSVTDQPPAGMLNGGTSSNSTAYYTADYSGFQQQQPDQFMRYPYNNQQRVPGYHAPTTGFHPRVNSATVQSGNFSNYQQQQPLYDGNLSSPQYVNVQNDVVGDVVSQHQYHQFHQPAAMQVQQHALSKITAEVEDAIDSMDVNGNNYRPSVPGGSGVENSKKKFGDESPPTVSSQPGNWASAAAGGKKGPKRPPLTNKSSSAAAAAAAAEKAANAAAAAADGNDDKTDGGINNELSYERTPSDLQQQPNEFGEWEVDKKSAESGGLPRMQNATAVAALNTTADSRASSSISNHDQRSVQYSTNINAASSSGKLSAARTMSSEASSPHPSSSTPDTMSTITSLHENNTTPLATVSGPSGVDSSTTPTNAGTAAAPGIKPFNYAAMLKKDVHGVKHTRVGVKGSGKVEVIPASAAVGFSAVGGPAAAPLFTTTTEQHRADQQNLDQQQQPQSQQHGGMGRVVQMSPQDYARLGQLFSSLEPLRTLRLSQSRGMRNTGTACYMNAVLQVLLACPQFANVLMSAERNIFHPPGGTGGSNAAVSAAAVNANVRCDFSKMPAFSALLWLWRLGKPSLAVRMQHQFASREASNNNTHNPIGFNTSLGGSTVNKPSNEPPIDPMPFYDQLKECGIMPYSKGQHQDAQEFYGALLNRLHEEMAEAMKFAKDFEEQQPRAGGLAAAAVPPPTASSGKVPVAAASSAPGSSSAALLASGTLSVNSSVSSDVDNGGSDSTEWNTVGKKGRIGVHRDFKQVETPIYKIFGGMRVNSYAAGSKEPSSAAEPFYQLMLYIQNTTAVDNVQQALSNLFVKDTFQGYKRADGRESSASSALHLQDLPLILVLNVMYAEYNEQARETRKFTTQKPLYVTNDILFEKHHFTKEALNNKSKPYGTNDEARKFKLMAAVYHVGAAATRGHFVALAFNMEVHGCWMLLDDEKVYTGNYKDLLDEHLGFTKQNAVPYLLFYRRNDTMAGTGGPKSSRQWQSIDGGNGGGKHYNSPAGGSGVVSGGGGGGGAGSGNQRYSSAGSNKQQQQHGGPSRARE